MHSYSFLHVRLKFIGGRDKCFFSKTLFKNSVGLQIMAKWADGFKTRKTNINKKIQNTSENWLSFGLTRDSSSLVLFFGHREGENSGSNSRMVDSDFEQDSIKSCEASMYVFLWDCSASLLWFGEMDFLQNSFVCFS